MRFIDLPGSNLILEKPKSMQDEDCMAITAFRGMMKAKDVNGEDCVVAYILVGIMPNKEDLEAMNAGRPIFIRTLGSDFSPMAVWTIDEEGKPND